MDALFADLRVIDAASFLAAPAAATILAGGLLVPTACRLEQHI